MKKLYSTAVRGRYEVFDICRELSNMGVLSQFISTYPKFFIKKYNIDLNLVTSFRHIEILTRINDKLWDRDFFFSSWDYYLTDYFDYLSSNVINKDSDIFIGHGGMCLRTFEKIKDKKLKVFHSTSMHINTKIKIMANNGYNKNKIIFSKMKEKLIKEIDKADLIVCTSQHTYNSFIDNRINEKKLFLNPSGINISRFYYDNRYEEKKFFKFLYVGNLSLRKGIITLIESYLKIRTNKTKLVLAGFIEKSLKSKINYYLKFKDIEFIGKIPNDELYKLYSSCHLKCLLSNEDGFAAVIGEALACGLPVLSTMNSGGSHFIKNTEEGKIINKPNIANVSLVMSDYVLKHEDIISNKTKLSNDIRNKYSWLNSIEKLNNKLIKC